MDTRDQARRARLGPELDETGPGDRTARPEGAERVRALQRSAGNHALSARLAREPDTATADTKPGASGLAVVPDVGTIPLLYVTFGGSRDAPVTGTAGGGSSGRSTDFHEVTLASKVGDHSPKLLLAVTDGKPGTVEIVTPSLTLTLKNAMVSSYNVSGAGENPTEAWSLNFDSFERK
jgi:Type VI secretion system effector, Hcp